MKWQAIEYSLPIRREEALKILNDPDKSVDLVITNLRHVGSHGLEFIRLLKRGWRHLPIICHTALSEYRELPAYDRPFDAFVEKSSDLAILKHNVDNLIGKTD